MANGIDLSQFHEIFFEESYEGLEAMEAGLLKMDRGVTEPEVVNTVFRAAHSIKGSAGTFGFAPISNYTHVVETLLDEVRAGTRKVSKEFIDLMLKSVDFLRQMINETKAGNEIEEAEVESRIALLQEFGISGEVQSDIADAVSADAGSADNAGSSAVKKGKTKKPDTRKVKVDEIDSENKKTVADQVLNRWLIVFKPHVEMMLTGNDPFRFLRELKELGDHNVEVNTSNLPEWDRFDPEYCYLTWEIELSGDMSREDLSEIFEWIADDCELKIELLSGPVSEQEKQEEQEAPKKQEKLEAPEKQERQEEANTGSFKTGFAESLVSQPVISDAFQNDTSQSGDITDDRNQEITSIRVNIEKVDNLVNLVGELVITQSILNQFTMEDIEMDADKLQDGLVQLERNTRELQEETMRIRMLPIDSVFQRLPRIVRDLSGSFGKKVELKMHGNQTEVDKTVLEKIGDPLMHLVRNALDHGLEMPEERIRKGKPETGLIDVNAYHEGGNIIIEVMDDGAGLNQEKIRQKAIQRGLLKEEDEMTDSQVCRLIFAAGFTTAEQLSDVSGRGVGMDVVNKNISDLGGTTDVSSVEGAGCIFTIRLPLTLSIVDSQLVRVGNEVLIIPLLAIVKSLQIEKQHYGDLAGEIPVYRFQNDEYIPVIHVDKSFGIHIDEEDTDRILIVVDVGHKVGLLVNEVVGLQQVVVKALDSNYRQIEGIAGATILGDGKVAMIIDIGGLIRLEEARNNASLTEALANLTH